MTPLRRLAFDAMLDALDGVELTEAERRTLYWLADFSDSAHRIAAVIRRARRVLDEPEACASCGYAIENERSRCQHCGAALDDAACDDGEAPMLRTCRSCYAHVAPSCVVCPHCGGETRASW